MYVSDFRNKVEKPIVCVPSECYECQTHEKYPSYLSVQNNGVVAGVAGKVRKVFIDLGRNRSDSDLCQGQWPEFDCNSK